MNVDVSCFVQEGAVCRLDVSMGYSDRSRLVGDVGVARCRRCGVGLSHPPLADVAFLYSDRTSQDFQPSTGSLARAIKLVAFGMQARRLLSQLPRSPRRVVDFGCGSGLFTFCLARALPQDVSVTGTDFHASAPADLGNVAYRSMEELTDLAGSADLVLAMHVIEHDQDPRALVRRISDLASPEGHVVIEVPNVGCVWTRIFGKKWDAWYLPYHRVHFSRLSLREVVEAAGLEVIDMKDVCVPTMGRTMANVFGRPSGLIFLMLGILLHPFQWIVEVLLASPSALRIIARKP